MLCIPHHTHNWTQNFTLRRLGLFHWALPWLLSSCSFILFCFVFEARSQYVTQAILYLTILLSDGITGMHHYVLSCFTEAHSRVLCAILVVCSPVDEPCPATQSEDSILTTRRWRHFSFLSFTLFLVFLRCSLHSFPCLLRSLLFWRLHTQLASLTLFFFFFLFLLQGRVVMVLGFELRALCLLHRYSTTWAHPCPSSAILTIPDTHFPKTLCLSCDSPML
jgi:hypothetical protein